jgi:hypothetical protein
VQLETYQLVIASKEMNVDEIISSCTKCQYFEIWLKSSSAAFFHCRATECQNVHCVICKKDVVIPDENVGRPSSYDEELKGQDGVFYHFRCAELGELKAKFDNCIEAGMKSACPGCGHSGVKDGACTHMTCISCNTVWCYLCGGDDKHLDKSGQGSIYGHNDSWNERRSRCPMYLRQIREVDSTWPSDDKLCLEKLHRIRTLNRLSKFKGEVGLENLRLLFQHFTSLANSGFSIEDIQLHNPKKPLYALAGTRRQRFR